EIDNEGNAIKEHSLPCTFLFIVNEEDTGEYSNSNHKNNGDKGDDSKENSFNKANDGEENSDDEENSNNKVEESDDNIDVSW
ncbi:6542_t:CDS:1, partial [Racocetra persica]